MLTSPYEESAIQSVGSTEDTGARSPRAAATHQLDQMGLLNIVSHRKSRSPRHESKNSPEITVRKMIASNRSNSGGHDEEQSHHRHRAEEPIRRKSVGPGHGHELTSAQHQRDDVGKPPFSPTKSVPSLAMSPLTSPGSIDTAPARPTRRYVRGKPSPVASMVKKPPSFEEIDLGDGEAVDLNHIAASPTKDKANTSVKVAVNPTNDPNSTNEAVVSVGASSSLFSFFSRKPTKVVAPPLGGINLLQAVKTGRRASYIMEADVHAKQASSDDQDMDLTERSRGRTDSEGTSHTADNSYHSSLGRHDPRNRDMNAGDPMMTFLTASTTAFIADPSLHPDNGALGTVLEYAASWTSANKRMDSQFRQR